MFDRDLAELYEVETRVLNQAVKRNKERFPEDFMFQLNIKEMKIWEEQNLRSQFVILKRGQHLKFAPYVFTEQGVAMLSSVLKSQKSIEINIQIIRTFTKLREILSTHHDLARQFESLEKKYDYKIAQTFNLLEEFMTEKTKPKPRIGFHIK